MKHNNRTKGKLKKHCLTWDWIRDLWVPQYVGSTETESQRFELIKCNTWQLLVWTNKTKIWLHLNKPQLATYLITIETNNTKTIYCCWNKQYIRLITSTLNFKILVCKRTHNILSLIKSIKNIFSKICPDSQVDPLRGSSGGGVGLPTRARSNGQTPMIV